MTLSTGKDVLDVREETLKAGARKEVVLGDMPFIATPIKVELSINDPLKADNAAYIVMPERVRYKVALCAKGESVLLTKALESLPDCALYTYSGGQLSGPADEQMAKKQVAVWIVEGDSPCQNDKNAGYLFINTSKHPFLPVIPGPVVQNDYNADPPVVISVLNVDKGSELLRFVNLVDLRIKAMRRCRLQPWGKPVAEASLGPLLIEGHEGGSARFTWHSTFTTAISRCARRSRCSSPTRCATWGRGAARRRTSPPRPGRGSTCWRRPRRAWRRSPTRQGARRGWRRARAS